jgi:tetratricopeptide (TPR) repeat protein
MSRLTELNRLLCGAACVLALSACTTTAVKPTPPTKLPLEQVLGSAGEASRAGQKEQALKLLDQAALDYPADPAPWLQKAQIKFDGGQYAEAILDAQQVLGRNPTDKVANSIVAIAGLRLSTAALSDLIRQNNLSGSLRSETQELAKLLRESLGEGPLLKDVKPKVVPQVTPPRNTRRTGTTPPPQPAAKDSKDASPFDDLK